MEEHMLPEELPTFLRQLHTHNAALDPMHLMYDNVLRSGYLHFGYWPVDTQTPPGILAGFCSAQERFAEELMSSLPAGQHRLLDVGAGMGRLADELTKRGHWVTAITPSSVQAAHIRDHYPAVTVCQGYFQDVGSTLEAKGFDLIVFSESFRYMPLDRVMPLFRHLLSEQGRVFIGDWFTRRSGPSRPGHDHNEALFRQTLSEHHWAIIAERDVTQNVLPTLILGREVLCHLYLPLAGLLLSKFAQKWPRVYRICLPRMIRWVERRILPQLTGRFEPAVFAADYRYLFLLLAPTA
jgi:SAM-dependent methyltransferase